jgi:hypothetical protein
MEQRRKESERSDLGVLVADCVGLRERDGLLREGRKSV